MKNDGCTLVVNGQGEYRVFYQDQDYAVPGWVAMYDLPDGGQDTLGIFATRRQAIQAATD